MRKQHLLVVILTMTLPFWVISQNPTTLSLRNISKHNFSAQNLTQSVNVVEKINIPLKFNGNTIFYNKNLKCHTQIVEIRDYRDPAGQKIYKGELAGQKMQCKYSAFLSVIIEQTNNKTIDVKMKETDKLLTFTYGGRTWSEKGNDDKDFLQIGSLPNKNKATFKRKGRENDITILLKNIVSKSKKKKKTVKNVTTIPLTDKVCPISSDVLLGVVPGIKEDVALNYAPYLYDAMAEFDINTPSRINMFLAQLSHESDNFRIFVEEGPAQYFRRYENKKYLGNVHPGDGFRYRGRGPLQITGRSNYKEVGEALGVDLELNPELLEDPYYAFRASAWWWKKHGLNEKMDQFPDNVKVATKVINGGYRHLSHRQKKYFAIHNRMNKMEC